MQLKSINSGGRGKSSCFPALFRKNMICDGLVALGVYGDAFLYRRADVQSDDGTYKDWLILVDGGGSGERLRKQLNLHAAGVQYLDIVVCTHGDSDHSGGLGTFLDRWGHRPRKGANPRGAVGEFWLPGRWVGVVKALLEDPRSVFEGLMVEMDDLRQRNPDWRNLDATKIEELISEQVKKAEIGDKNVYDGDEFVMPEEVDLRKLAADRRKGTISSKNSREKVFSLKESGSIGEGFGEYWISLIDTVDEIRLIAHQALRHGSRVRWFDFEEFSIRRVAVGGINRLLKPINAVESAPMPPRIALYAMLQLTRINEQSLVFYAPETDRNSAVLFCGDSPLGLDVNYSVPFPMIEVPHRDILVTAPHHGSSSNDIAYRHLLSWKRDERMILVRSGGERLHPDGEFQFFLPPERACTNCRRAPNNFPPTAIGFIQLKSSCGSWCQLNPKRVCNCV
ncbi:MBL fold metallo-hydrolase [Azospirillum sp. Sh1]|uniref:MBL fold metallo-hydrolase n=1 Tax=Azospirillum sp. Sh1 TaxID=2607285 RepID=UPI00165DB7EC|nr:MBL fold metallo-hydrolase [Azospirillum sp. Sh1]